MTSKERVLRSLEFQPVDRIAKFDNFWLDFEQNCRQVLGINNETDLTEYFDIDIVIAGCDESPYPSMAKTVSESDDSRIYRNSYGAVVRSRKNGFFEEEIEFLINEYDDIERFPFESAANDSRYTGFINYAKKQQAKGKCVFGKIGGPFIRSTFVRGKENFLMDLAGDEGFAKEIAGRLADMLLQIGLEELRRGGLHDTGIWIYDDMGYNNGPLFSPRIFERVFYPLYKKMVRELKNAGANKVCLHSDGDIRLFLDMLIDSGIDAINPVEPRAGMSIRELKAKYGKKLAYIGGMCNSDILKNGPEERIIKQAEEIIELAKDGGVIIGSHSIGPDIPLDNYLAYHRCVMEKGNMM